jgi:hypothetical protein
VLWAIAGASKIARDDVIELGLDVGSSAGVGGRVLRLAGARYGVLADDLGGSDPMLVATSSSPRRGTSRTS